jgi:hypothetical protein
MDIKDLLKCSDSCDSQGSKDDNIYPGFLIGSTIGGICAAAFAFFQPVKGWLGRDPALAVLVLLLIQVSFGFVGQYLYTKRNQKKKHRVSADVLHLVENSAFVSETNSILEKALRLRKKVYSISGTRTVQNGETVDEIIEVGESLIEPEYSEEEGRLAHLYRCLTAEAKEALAKACPLISETRISTVRTPGALGHPPGRKENR